MFTYLLCLTMIIISQRGHYANDPAGFSQLFSHIFNPKLNTMSGLFILL